MTTLYIVRHAEAEGNVFRRMDGHYDSNITPNGRRQIEALAKRFADVSIDAVYASDLCRTRRTAEAITLPKQLPLHPDPRLREVWFGPWEDVPFGQLDFEAAEQMDHFSHAPERWLVEGAELYPQAAGRFADALYDIARRHPGQSVAVFTHGCISSWGFRRLFGDRMHQAGRCDNTGVSLLQWAGDSLQPVYFYDNSHLSAEISTLEHQRWWRGTHEFNLRYRLLAQQDHDLVDPAFAPIAGQVQRLALRMDEPVGYLSYDPQTATLGCIYLKPSKRNLRMGPQLLGEAVCACRALGHKTLRARFPMENKPAAAFFASCGAEIVCQDAACTATLRIDVAQG